MIYGLPNLRMINRHWLLFLKMDINTLLAEDISRVQAEIFWLILHLIKLLKKAWISVTAFIL